MPNELIALANSEGIIIRHANLPADILGVYYSTLGKPPVIILEKEILKSINLTRCILAEELGHHFTCGINLIAFARQQKYESDIEKYEKHAIWWATKFLMPWDELVRAVLDKNITLEHELAEYFKVTDRFLRTGLDLYAQKHPRNMTKILSIMLTTQEGQPIWQ